MQRKDIIEKISVIFFLMAVSLPYLIHPSQDLSPPVGWDEATQSLNAKDIVLFGPASIKDDRSSYIAFSFKTLLGLISFSVFGVSLFSLRLPYILLAIAGNILFFILVRKKTNTLVAVMATFGFILYPTRLVMGKSGMYDSLVLSLVLIVLWLLGSKKSKRRVYFWLGILGVLITWVKLDNIAAPVFLTGFCLLRFYQERRAGNPALARKILTGYFSGVVIISFMALIFYTLVGWHNVMFWVKYFREAGKTHSLYPVPLHNTVVWVKYLTDGHSWSGPVPCSLKLLWQNLCFLYVFHPCLAITTILCLFLFIGTLRYSKEARKSPLNYGILFTIFLLFGKLYISMLFFERRYIPCFPLPFLLMAHTIFFVIVQPTNLYINRNSRLSLIKIKAIKLAKSLFVLIFAGGLIYLMYLPNGAKTTKDIIFHPTYDLLNEARILSSILMKTDKVLSLDGRFGYLAIQSPNKFIDIPQDLNASSFYLLESNPPLAREMIKRDARINYVVFREDNLVMRKMMEEEFNTQLVASYVAGCGFLYRIER